MKTEQQIRERISELEKHATCISHLPGVSGEILFQSQIIALKWVLDDE